MAGMTTILDIPRLKRKRTLEIDTAGLPSTTKKSSSILPVLPSGQTDKKKAAAIKKSQGLTKEQVKKLEAQFAAGKKKATLDK
jgi:hypothetical protein